MGAARGCPAIRARPLGPLRLTAQPDATGPTVVFDADIATQQNIEWLTARGYRYLAVSCTRAKQADEQQVALIKEEGGYPVICWSTGKYV